jgi:hypothetical protein
MAAEKRGLDISSAIALALLLCVPACGPADDYAAGPGGGKGDKPEQSMMFGLAPAEFFAGLSGTPLQSVGEEVVLRHEDSGRAKVVLTLSHAADVGEDGSYELAVRDCLYGVILNRSCDAGDFEEGLVHNGITKLEGRDLVLYDGEAVLARLAGFVAEERTPAAVLHPEWSNWLHDKIGDGVVLFPEEPSRSMVEALEIGEEPSPAIFEEMMAKYDPSRPQFVFDFARSRIGSALPWKGDEGEAELKLFLFEDNTAYLRMDACTYNWQYYCYHTYEDDLKTFEGTWAPKGAFIEITSGDGSRLATLSGYNLGAFASVVLAAGPELSEYIGNYVAIAGGATTMLPCALVDEYAATAEVERPATLREHLEDIYCYE